MDTGASLEDTGRDGERERNMQAEAVVRERPKRNREATRQRLLEAARDLFGEHGYDGVTVRMIASAAEANMALVNRYFGSKAALFAEVLEGESSLNAVITAPGPPEGPPLPRRLAEHFVRQVHRGPASTLSRMMDRSVGNAEVREILQQHMNAFLVEPIVEQLDGPHARTRALLAATLIMGGGPVRRMFGLADLREAEPAALTDRLEAMFAQALSPTVP
ncbi:MULTISPECIES: TetR/AcrR family transcriptional regulator [Actinomadura]|uniref:TetR/AcrR family transcriptional regulator n=1 Tax=Actinomadura yumaensis TaxID=111807 RepID=A0ABW2CDI8_9ACTN|nr:TetR/AcrR family transcriptional regulator [Actinomadura sp. J1-007]